MDHTQLIRLILDATRADGVLFHTLSPSQRVRIQSAGRAYALGHATGQPAMMADGQRTILEIVHHG